MGDVKLTPMQQAAVEIRNKNILVSAAAGSGKTSVLVERIIRRVLDDNIDIDRILVMTFTRAAAAQMKEKILDAINKKRAVNPHDDNLNRQYALVHNANIVTIDSFCMNVVKNHFSETGLSPDFRMADEGEMRLIQQDVLEAVLEQMYESGSPEFLKMTEVFASKKSDIDIEETVLALYNYAQSYPDPDKWLDKCAVKYAECIDSDDFRPEWVDVYAKSIKRRLNDARRMADAAGDICMQPLGPEQYISAVESDINLLDSLLSFESYEELYNVCNQCREFKFEAFSRKTPAWVKKADVSAGDVAMYERLKEQVKGYRGNYKDTVNDIISTVNANPFDVIVSGMTQMASPVIELSMLVKRFTEALAAKKREKNIVDFSDIEHMCLAILRNKETGTAEEYKRFFEEIYVDEYQDSNYVQEEILNLIARDDGKCGNVFMVGDVKQSIYGFRMARPELFVNKYERYEKHPATGAGVRIDLSDNFRSRKEVLSSVNSIFSRIMDKEHGGIVYDEAARLNPGMEYIDTGYNYDTDVMLLVHDDDVNDREAEALMVANRIKEIVKSGFIEKDKKPVRVKYSDIVILLRTAKGWDNVFMKVLAEQGIPVYVAASTGYFEAEEVRTLLNFLKVIDNPLQDIPLSAVLMSVIGDFSAEDVALIRGAFKEGCLYDAMKQYADTYSGSEDEKTPDTGSDNANVSGKIRENMLAEKIEKFLNKLEYYRKKAEYAAVSEIITEIIDGEYGKIIKALPHGEKAYANLNMLLNKAVEYGTTSYKGIFHFNRYIEAIRKYEIDYGEANLSDENDNAVRIMTIHKSKGLEFPVCFVCGMAKGFNTRSLTENVLTDADYGIATDIIDTDRRIKTKSLLKKVVSDKKKKENIAEEMRVLYVAMTRAKEKLIMTGCVKKAEMLENELITMDSVKSYLDMYICARNVGEPDNITERVVSIKELVSEVVKNTVDTEVERARVLSVINGSKAPEASEYTDEIIKRLKFKYDYEDKGCVKLSVSELKHKSDKMKDDEAEGDNDVTRELYEYEPGQTNKGALHGSAVHRIFEIWDYNRPATDESVDEFLKYVHEEGLIEDELFKLVRRDEIAAFVKSDIAERMRQAYFDGTLKREQPFVISDDPDDADSMLIQGIIDAYFVEEGKIVLVDYKTDRGKSESQLISDHRIQLEYYARALERLTHMEIKESVIYSTFLSKSITIL